MGQPAAGMVCERCYSTGTARKSTSGAAWFGAILGVLVAFLSAAGGVFIGFALGFAMVLGFAVGGTKTRCTGCGHAGFVPAASPRGRQLQAEAERSAGLG